VAGEMKEVFDKRTLEYTLPERTPSVYVHSNYRALEP